MSTYITKADKRNTSGGITPNKAIRRPPSAAPKKPAGMKQTMRRPQGR